MTIQELISLGCSTGAVVGFALGTGWYLFAWMGRQVYAIFRKIVLAS